MNYNKYNGALFWQVPQKLLHWCSMCGRAMMAKVAADIPCARWCASSAFHDPVIRTNKSTNHLRRSRSA